MKKHSLTLMGGLRGELRVPASILHEAVGALIEGARLATRFAVEGESVRKGPRPAWLDTACAIDVVRLSAGSAVIALEAPTLQDAADRLFESAPVARSGSPLVFAVAQDDSSGVASFFGTWPGDESEDELPAALRELA